MKHAVAALRRIAPLVSLLSCLPTGSLRAQGTEIERSLMAVVGLDLTSADIVAWCESSSPADAPPMRTAWQAWRTRSAIDSVGAKLSTELMEKTRTGMQRVSAATRQRMNGMGTPATVCRQLVTMWASESFDVRAKFPLAYERAAVVTGAIVTGATVTGTQGGQAATAAPTPRAGRRFDPQYYLDVSRPTGEVYTVSQLTALFRNWYGTPRDRDRAFDRMKASNPLFVRGKVVPRREHFYLESHDGTFTSKLSVSPTIDISAFEGQEITLALMLKELPGASLIFPDRTRLVRDPSGLRPSSLTDEQGRRRLQVDVARITAAAGRGAPAARIRGMHYRGYGTTGANGYEFREELRLLFTDGWAYTREDLPPSDLDVEASRRLEPQYWARWRQVAGAYEFQEQDDMGRPDGEWQRKDGRLLGAWTPNQRISGGYTAAAFYGSIALGGTYSKSTYMLGNDGRWEYLGYSRSSSAAMAAQSPVEFSASATSTTDGKGTQSTAGGGNPGVFVGSRSRTDDGAKNRGTYRLDGMTLELRSDAGEVHRYLCVPLDTTGDMFYLLGRSFSRKRS